MCSNEVVLHAPCNGYGNFKQPKKFAVHSSNFLNLLLLIESADALREKNS